jgi:hypothetical protein
LSRIRGGAVKAAAMRTRGASIRVNVRGQDAPS